MLDATALANECDGALPLVKAGEFFGPAGEMALGTGIVLSNLVQPIYLSDKNAYATATGAGIILTHECDIDPANIRPFNENALVAPLMTLTAFVTSATAQFSDEDARKFMLNVAAGYTTRLIYLPRNGPADSPLYNGAILDLNYITSCGIQALAQATVITSLTGYAISAVDRALQNHLFREKADTPPYPHA